MPETMLILLILVVVFALIFDFINGFHDTANAVAAAVSTTALTGRQAIILSGTLNFVGALVGTAVAKTIVSKIVDPTTVGQGLVVAALFGAIVWNLLTWWLGIPSSSSHAILGGILGASLATHGFGEIKWGTVGEIFLALVTSPLCGFVIAFTLMVAVFWIFRRAHPAPLRRRFLRLQLLGVTWLSFSHGSNDAQKSMGIITMALIAFTSAGHPLAQWILPSHMDAATHKIIYDVPFWVKLFCATAIGFGTASGGWRIIKTMGKRVVRLEAHHGLCADLTSALVISTFTHFGLPVSTTHVVSGSIMGVGATKRLSAVRWGVAGNIMLAWVLTVPVTAGIAWCLYKVMMFLGLP